MLFFVFGLAFGIVVGATIARIRLHTTAAGVQVTVAAKPEVKAVATKFDVRRTSYKPGLYGHPWDPVESVLKSIPIAPDGWFWEISIAYDDQTNPWLELTLEEIATGRKISTSFSLTHASGMHSDFAWRYVEYPAIKDQTFMKFLIAPITQWAAKQVDIAENKAGTREKYRTEL